MFFLLFFSIEDVLLEDVLLEDVLLEDASILCDSEFRA